MHTPLTTELYWLILTITMTALFWLPYIANRIIELGAWATLSVPDLHPEAQWAQRLMKAHANAVENLVVFAPLLLIVQITGMNSSITATTSMVYFFTRLIHVIAYLIAVPVVRTFAFVGGFFCQLVLVITLLNAF
ncbi:MAG TPA: MAPEG family protein [Crenotrichaceae bacterium]|nr:MAPEG family protein [Crenotrichaceae bacterium]